MQTWQFVLAFFAVFAVLAIGSLIRLARRGELGRIEVSAGLVRTPILPVAATRAAERARATS